MRKLEEILQCGKVWEYRPMLMEPYGIMKHTAWIKLPDCGTCSVIWDDNEYGMEHVSVSPKRQFKIPSWDDMCILKDIFFRDKEEAYQIHPKKSEYVNLMENCLHLWKPKGHEMSELVEEKTNEID